MDSKPRSFELIWPFAAMLVGVITVVVTLFFRPGSESFRTAAIGVLAGLLTIGFVGAYVVLVRRLLRVRKYDLRVAITGLKGAGKSVLSLLLYDQLMNVNATQVMFSPEARSAISTYQAIRGIGQGDWPASTKEGIVERREGEISFGRRTRVNLEIGDTAGEHWLNLGSGSAAESSYLEYVLSAGAVIHVIDASALAHTGVELLTSDLADLRLAANLMRGIKRGESSNRAEGGPRILVVFTKMDLLEGYLQESRLRVFTPDGLIDTRGFRTLYEATGDEMINAIDSFSDRLSGDFKAVDYMFSSIDLLTTKGSFSDPDIADVLDWFYKCAVRPAKSGPLSPQNYLR